MSTTLLESNYLIPEGQFFLILFLVFIVLVAWPLIETLRTREFAWAAVILVFAPLGGAVWVIWWLVRRAMRART